MLATVLFRLPDGSTRVAGHGDLVGRLHSAAVHLDDARVSEAHALISLRGGELRLLALRGRFALDGEPLTTLVLAPGQRVELARDLVLEVLDLELPDEVLALEGEGLPRQILTGPCSLHVHPRPRLTIRYEPGADAHIWNVGRAWRLQLDGEAMRPLEPGATWEIGGRTFGAVAVPLHDAARPATGLRGGLHATLRIVALYDTVHIHREGEPVVAISGIPARIISELAAIAMPADWHVVAREVWPDSSDRQSLRKKWDVSIARLRRKLRHARVRPDLLRADGSGNLELFLYDHDRIEDRS